MGQLRLRVLGGPEIRDDERRISFRSRKAFALLIYLAVEGRTVSREACAAKLWPEADATRARALLRSTLSYLRQPFARGDEPPLRAEGSLLWVERERLALDLHALEDCLARIQRRAAATDHAVSAAELSLLLEQLNALAPGPFLDGFSLDDADPFDTWATLQRQHLDERVSQGLAQLARLAEQSGDRSIARAIALRRVAHDPLSEEAHRALIQVHAALGDRGAALHAYDTYASLLADAFKARPAVDLAALADRLRGEARPAHPSPPAPAASHRTSPSLDIPFVGRSQEFASLVRGYELAAAGHTHLVLIDGASGMGKTRLAHEFLVWASSQGADVLGGRADDVGRIPYGPVVDALRPRLDRERALDDLLSDVWLSELSLLLPEIRDRLPDLPPPLADDATVRTRLFASVVELGVALAAQAPLILFLDDIQWADTATTGLLQYVGQQWATRAVPALLILAVRREDLLTTPALADWLATPPRRLPTTRLSLDPLAAAAVSQLIAGLRRQEPSQLPDGPHQDDVARRVYAATGGYPLALVELLTTLQQQHLLPALLAAAPGELQLAALENLDALVRHGLRTQVEARLTRFTAAARDVLAAAAVLGSQASFDTLTSVAGLPVEAGLEAVEAALATQLLREQEPSRVGGVRYAFRHDNGREVVYTLIGATRRQVLHQRALAALQARGAPPAVLAHHAQAAGDEPAAVRMQLAAGDAALALRAVDEAVAHYTRARQLLDDHRAALLDRLDDLTVERCFVHLGRAYEAGQQWDAAREAYEALRGIGREGRPGLECAALNRLAILAMLRAHDVAAAAALLEEARLAAERSGDRACMAETVWNLAQVATVGWDVAGAQAYGEQALSLARALEAPELTARCLLTLAEAANFGGRWDEVVAPGAEARALFAAQAAVSPAERPLATPFIFGGSPVAHQLHARSMEALCASNLAIGHLHLGETAAAQEAGRAGVALARAVRNPYVLNICLINHAHALEAAGQYGAALACTEEALAVSATLASPQQRFWACMRHAITSLAVFQLAVADQLFAEAEVLAAQMGHPTYRLMLAANRCTHAVLEGNWPQAIDYAREASTLRQAAPVRLLWIDVYRHHEVAALLRADEAELARSEIAHLRERVGGNRRFAIVLRRMEATLAQSAGGWDVAAAALREALAGAEALDLPGEQWTIAAQLRQLYATHGADGKAREAQLHVEGLVHSLAQTLETPAARAAYLAAALEDARRAQRVVG